MQTRSEKALRFLLTAVLFAALCRLAVRFILPWSAPLIIALLLAAAAEPAVRFLTRRLRFPRSAAAGLCTAALAGGALLLVFLAGVQTWAWLRALAAAAPKLLDGLTAGLSRTQSRILGFVSSLDGEALQYFTLALDALSDFISALPEKLSGKLLAFLSVSASKTPDLLLFAVTAVIGMYFFSAAYPAVKTFVERQLTPLRARQAAGLFADMRATVRRWLSFQLIMTAITFITLLAAFRLLRIDRALTIAFVTALVDALPVFGTGIILLPWCAYELLTGNLYFGAGLAVTYTCVTVLHSCLQAKLLGDRLGLHPIISLGAIYIGWCAAGVAGMIMAPLIAITLKQLNDRGILKLWK